MQYIAIVSVVALGVVGFVIYLWQKDKRDETDRLYAFIDDIFDRINSGTIEQYAFTQRIKKEIFKTQQQVENPEAKIEKAIERGKIPPKFVQTR